MIPAGKRLESGNRAILQPDDRLVQHLDFLALDGAAQFRFHGQTVGLARAHGRLEDFDPVAADALGVVHRKLGILEDLIGALCLIFGKRHSNRGSQEDFAVVEGDRCAQGTANGFGKADDACGLALGQENHRELIARKTRQRILGFEQACKPAGDREQDRIADSHADGVVDLLESVEIDHNDRRPDIRVSPGKAEGCFQPVNEQFAVGQAGEVVMNRVKQQSFLGGLEISHVGERAHEPDNLAIGSDHGARLQREP